jgi:hypothetical protein
LSSTMSNFSSLAQGSILQDSISAENILHKFSSSNFGQISTQKQQMYLIFSDYYKY